MARKPKPTAAKILQGTFRPDRSVENEVKHEAAKLEDLAAPDWFDGVALKKWEEITPRLLESGVLTVVDIHNMEAFCTSYSMYRAAQEQVDKEGLTVPTLNGGIQKNPAVTALNEALTKMASYGALLGLDPSSRTKISGKAGDKPDNPFSKL